LQRNILTVANLTHHNCYAYLFHIYASCFAAVMWGKHWSLSS